MQSTPQTAGQISTPGSDSKVSSSYEADLLEAVLGSTQDAIFTVGRDGVVTSWNAAAVQIFGYLPGEIIGKPYAMLIPASLQDSERQNFSKVLQGLPAAHGEVCRVKKDGEEALLALTATLVGRGQDVASPVVVVARNITGQRTGDLARFRLASIVESADDAILSKDLDGTITSWNEAAERLFGYTEEEILGSSILRLIPEELQSEEALIISRIRRGERVKHYESVRMRKDGGLLHVSLTISPIRDGLGEVIGASKIVRDLTDRKDLESYLVQAEKLAAKGKMAATIAHEINNPLEAVLNLIYLARSNSSDPEIVEFLRSAENELVRLAMIARQTLGFYRESSVATVVSLPSLVKDALRLYEIKMKVAGIALQIHLEATEPLALRKGELMQVIANLLTNAIHAMPGGGSLSVSVVDLEENGKRGVCLSVRDSGTGIADEHMSRIFEPFFTTRSSDGTGIGLWVVKQFVEGHGGRIRVQSSTAAEAHGTIFTIWLPFVNPYTAEASADPLSAQ